MTWDVDGNGQFDALTDGKLILGYLFGLTGDALIRNSIAPDATRREAAEIIAYLESIRDQLDVDGNGIIDALTDAILYLRHLFGFTGDALTRGAVGGDATRGTAEQIVAYLESLSEDAPILPVDPETGAQYFPGALLVKLTDDVTAAQVGSLSESLGAISIELLVPSGLQSESVDGQWYVATFDPNANLEDIRNSLVQNPNVSDVEFDYLLESDFLPNDPEFEELWGLNNTDQNSGTVDADIDAPEAWDIQRGSRDVVVAVVDTGVDYNHQDLADNIWTNPGEIPNNGIDDDDNGFIDDFYGWDWVNLDNDPIDDNSHGTHVAGTIGAVGDNNLGVVGVSPNVSIMSLKFLDARNRGFTSNAVEAIEYATNMGADVINASFGGVGYNDAMVDALKYASDRGVLLVAAAGNEGKNNDDDDDEDGPHYPSSYDIPGLISVAATDSNDQLALFSNFGLTKVDLAAPGEAIFSTIPGNQYGLKNGTSMATPHVAGAAALLLAEDPSLTPIELKDILMRTTDKLDILERKIFSEGRLNLNEAIREVMNNSRPIAVNDSVIMAAENTAAIPVLANDSDPDGDSLSITGVSISDLGTATIGNNELLYTPTSGFTGSDSLTYTISDSKGMTDTAVVSINVQLAGRLTGTDDSEIIVGSNTLSSETGTEEILEGGGGNDTLIGGRGLDILLGGPGKDVFLYKSLVDSGADPDELRKEGSSQYSMLK